MIDALRCQLRDTAGKYLRRASGCHRLDHTVRVVANAAYLARHYAPLDDEALETAAWLHDIGRGVERAGGVSHAQVSARLAERILPRHGFSPERVALIRQAIADHRFSEGKIPASLEGRLLQDADRLDALGAIGIARTFTEGSGGRELYHPDDPFAIRRKPDDIRYTLDHFYVKLLKLPDTLHTPEARMLAGRRVEMMQGFLRALADEIHLAHVMPADLLPLLDAVGMGEPVRG